MGDGGDELTGRRVLVVGASAGIGREAALRFAERGADVVFSGRRQDKLDEAVTLAGRGHAIAVDVTDPHQCHALVSRAAELLDGIDLVVFCAAVSRILRLREATAGDWDAILRTNVIGPALVLQAALPHLRPGAVVALLSSESVGAPFPGLVPYGTSKAALEELIRGFRVEHPEVRFCRVTIGSTEGTEFARDFDVDVAAELFPRWVALGRLPDRLMLADEVGRVLADLLAVALATPGVDCQDLVLRAPGAEATGDADDFVAMVEGLSALQQPD